MLMPRTIVAGSEPRLRACAVIATCLEPGAHTIFEEAEAEELSPLEHAERLIERLRVPKQFVVYAEARHAVGGVPSANFGPFPPTLAADWMAARLAGKPFASERWYVEPTGRVVKTLL
jgi:hypothetical protein